MNTVFTRLVTLFLATCTGLSVLLVSGCLVGDDDDSNRYSRTTNAQRIYEDGDFIRYEIFATKTQPGFPPTTIEGTLRIRWSAIQIPAPYAGGVLSVMKETSDLDLSDGTDTTYIRYIQQDASGTISLVAFGNEADPDFVAPLGPDPLSNAAPVAINQSPAPTGLTSIPVGSAIGSGNTTYGYHVMDDCLSPPSCASFMTEIADTINYIGNASELYEYDIKTRIGEFNTIRYDYDLSFVNKNTIFSYILDQRMMCDANGLVFRGQAYLFPEVGVIEYFMDFCTANDGSGYIIRATVDNTNIPLP